MTRNEFIVQTAQIILNDWRKAMLQSDDSRFCFNLPGDTVDISWRSFQKASEIADQFYSD